MREAATGEEVKVNPCKISIVVAVYNTSQYLERCLERLTHQTLPPEEYEIIVVNDGSADRSVEIIRRYMEQYKNISFIDKENEGTFWCRIDGMYRVKGQYVGFVDSDDWIEERMYETLYNEAKKQQADIIECQLASGMEAEPELKIMEAGRYEPREILQLFSSRKISAALWRRIYKRELVEDVAEKFLGVDREEYKGIRNEDEFLFPLLLVRAHQYNVISDGLYHYRVDSNGSIMGEIKTDYQKKLFHVKTLLKAGMVLMQDTRKDKQQYQVYFWRMQTDNLFYALRILKESGYVKDIQEYHIYMKEHNRRCFLQSGLTPRDYVRKIHLNIKWKLCIID